MELSHKTTILLSAGLHERLKSLGELVREACIRQDGLSDAEDRLAAVEAMAAMSLPVGTVEDMKQESVPPPCELPA
jgi:hypothetical protein